MLAVFILFTLSLRFICHSRFSSFSVIPCRLRIGESMCFMFSYREIFTLRCCFYIGWNLCRTQLRLSERDSLRLTYKAGKLCNLCSGWACCSSQSECNVHTIWTPSCSLFCFTISPPKMHSINLTTASCPSSSNLICNVKPICLLICRWYSI
jgi:hypothetical protein